MGIGNTLASADPGSAGRKRPRGRPVDLMHAFAGLGRTSNIKIAWTKLSLETDRRPYELMLAEAVAQQLKENIKSGRNPSGKKSKPVSERTVKERGTGPRGVATGATVDSIRLVEHDTYVGVAITERAKGAFRHAMNGARWTYNPNDHLIKSALARIVEVLVHPETGTPQQSW